MESGTVHEQDINDETIGKYTPNSLKRSSTPLSTESSLHGTPVMSNERVW